MAAFRRGALLHGNSNALPGLPQSTRPAQPMVRDPQPLPGPPPPPPPQPIPTPRGPSIDMGRLAALEQRLASTEQSNRSLMDELMRLQQELRVGIRKTESGLQEEQGGRQRSEAVLRQMQGQFGELDARIVRAENMAREGKDSIGQLLNHTRNIEKVVTTGQQDMLSRRDQQVQRLNELRHEIDACNRAREQLERLIISVRDESQQNGHRMESVNAEITQLKGSLLGMNSMAMMKRDGALTPNANNSMMEAKVMQLNQFILDLDNKIQMEKSAREMMESQSNQRWQQLLSEVSATKRLREQQNQRMEMLLRETYNLSDVDKQKIVMQISAVNQELRRMLDVRDAKLREEMAQLQDVRGKLDRLNTGKADEDKRIKEEINQKLAEAGTLSEEGINALRRLVEEDRKKNQEKFKELTDRQDAMEDGMEKTAHELEKAISEESQERQKFEQVCDAKIEDLNDRMRQGLGALQAAIGAGGIKLNQEQQEDLKEAVSGVPLAEVEEMNRKTVEGVKVATAKQIGGIQEKVKELELKVEQQQETLDRKVKLMERKGTEDSSVLGDKFQQRIDGLAFTQDKLQLRVKDLETQMKSGKPKTDEEQPDATQKKLQEKIDLEKKERVQDVDSLKKRIALLAGNEAELEGASLATLKKDVQANQTGMRKLAEALQIVRTTLSEKIKEEKKQRETEVLALQTDMKGMYDRVKVLKEKVTALEAA